MRMRGWVFVIAGPGFTAACLAGGGPTRLYPDPKHPLAPERVVTLSGYVKFVDGEDVESLDRPFELLPGCHVVETPTHWGASMAGGTEHVTSHTGRWFFVLPTRAGYQYEISVIDKRDSGSAGFLNIEGVESDLAGNRTAAFRHTVDSREIADCQREAANARRARPSTDEP